MPSTEPNTGDDFASYDTDNGPESYDSWEFRGTESYLNGLTQYSDDGYKFGTPLRYSIADWWTNLASVPKSATIRRISSHLIFNGLWSVTVVLVAFALPSEQQLPVPALFDTVNVDVVFELTGGILGILLAFRTGQSYDRFWNGRMVWAKVISKTRALARAANVYIDDKSDGSIDHIIAWLLAFPIALKQHLRAERNFSEFKHLGTKQLNFLQGSDHLPVAVCYALTEALNTLKSQKGQEQSGLVWWQMESFVAELVDTVGEAEAIAGTPVPLSYSRHTSRLLSIWTICLPFVLVYSLPPEIVPIATIIVSWMLLGTEEIGHIIEEPFGLHEDRPQILPLEKYCEVVKRDVAQILSMRGRFDGEMSVTMELDETQTHDKPPYKPSPSAMSDTSSDTSQYLKTL